MATKGIISRGTVRVVVHGILDGTIEVEGYVFGEELVTTTVTNRLIARHGRR